MAAAPASITIEAPAKINLALHVTGRRDDGYHLLESLVTFTEFGDTLTIKTADDDRFAVSGPFADAIGGTESNIVLRARDAFRDAAGWHKPVAIGLHKRLPVASGIGGGSSDAAACLKALNRLAGEPLTMTELAQTGLALGADIAMCLHAEPLIARGIGEQITLCPGLPRLFMVLANPQTSVSTAEVFAGLDCADNPPLPALQELGDAQAVAGYLQQTRNDLLDAAGAIEPSIVSVTKRLVDAGALFARMSGSGATCFGLFSDEKSARQAARAIHDAEPRWFVQSTPSIAHGDRHEPN